MASWVLSECGLRPLPKIYTRPRSGLTSMNATNPSKIKFPQRTDVIGSSFWVSSRSRERNWALSVTVPHRVQSLDEENISRERINGVKDEIEFDPGSPPPFRLADIRAAIPKHCWVKNPWRSMGYVVRDVVVVLGLAAVAAYFNNWVVWPLYWIAQGTMFWALFVLGHDCGHGSFSNNHKLNSVVGHLLHSSILVPYHGCAMHNKCTRESLKTDGKYGLADPEFHLAQKKSIINFTDHKLESHPNNPVNLSETTV